MPRHSSCRAIGATSTSTRTFSFVPSPVEVEEVQQRMAGDTNVVDVDKVTLEVIENALKSVRFQMDAVVYRTAMSPIIREQHDEFPLITDRDGNMLVGQFGSFVGHFARTYPRKINSGDVFLISDPYRCEGAISHINDWL